MHFWKNFVGPYTSKNLEITINFGKLLTLIFLEDTKGPHNHPLSTRNYSVTHLHSLEHIRSLPEKMKKKLQKLKC